MLKIAVLMMGLVGLTLPAQADIQHMRMIANIQRAQLPGLGLPLWADTTQPTDKLAVDSGISAVGAFGQGGGYESINAAILRAKAGGQRWILWQTPNFKPKPQSVTARNGQSFFWFAFMTNLRNAMPGIQFGLVSDKRSKGEFIIAMW